MFFVLVKKVTKSVNDNLRKLTLHGLLLSGASFDYTSLIPSA